MSNFVENFKTGVIIVLLILVSLMIWVNVQIIKYANVKPESMALGFSRALDGNSIKMLAYENLYFNLGYQHSNANADFKIYWGNTKNSMLNSATIVEKSYNTTDSTWQFTIGLPKTTQNDSVYLGVTAVLNGEESAMSNILAFIPEVKRHDLVVDEQKIININDIRDLLKFHGKTSDKSL